MRNVWKGLIVGGMTGVAAGLILDSLAKASQKAIALGDQMREHAPDAGQWVQSVSAKTGEWLHDADVPDHLRNVAHKIRGSEAAGRMRDAGAEIASAAREASAAHSG